MKICNRYSLGVIIGSIHILISLIGFILLINVDEETIHSHNIIWIVPGKCVCVIVAVTSALLIWGIIRRSHHCLLPWMIMYFIEFNISCLWYVRHICILLYGTEPPFHEWLAQTFMYIIVIIFQIAVFGVICNLHRSIRMDNLNPPLPFTRNLLDDKELQR